MLLSVVVPCHNEESVLDALVAEVFKAIDAPDVELELVLVNDGSRDRTLELMQEHNERDSRVKYVSFSRNFGKEAAMHAGLTYAKGDAVVIMDADLQHPPKLVNEMIEHYREGYDQVVARRTRDGDPAFRTALSRLYYRLVNKLVDVPMEDGVGDFRLLSRRAVDALLAMRESNRFSKGLFSWVGFPRYTIDYKNQERYGGGASRWSMGRLLNYGIDGIMSFNNAPLRAAIEKACEGLVEAHHRLEIPALKMQAVEGIETDVMAYTTDIPEFGGAWGRPLLLGPGTIHVAHTSEERVPKRELIEAVDLYQKIVKQLLPR